MHLARRGERKAPFEIQEKDGGQKIRKGKTAVIRRPDGGRLRRSRHSRHRHIYGHRERSQLRRNAQRPHQDPVRRDGHTLRPVRKDRDRLQIHRRRHGRRQGAETFKARRRRMGAHEIARQERSQEHGERAHRSVRGEDAQAGLFVCSRRRNAARIRVDVRVRGDGGTTDRVERDKSRYGKAGPDGQTPLRRRRLRQDRGRAPRGVQGCRQQ